MNILSKAYYNNWNIGFIDKSIADVVLSEQREFEVKWLQHPYRDRFFADPFLLSANERELRVLVEEFPYYDKRGVISLLTIDRSSIKLISRKVILKQPFHMSYPFIFRKDDGSVWVAPEASQSGNLYRYTLNEAQCQLQDQHLLLPYPALDSTIIHRDGKWWLFCTMRGPQSNAELHIFYADAPEGPYIAHVGNPVLTDSAMARPTGSMFTDRNGDIYRMCQDCTTSYGSQINISKITSLSTDSYAETFVKSIHAQRDKYRHAFHTINGINNVCVVDGLSTSFAPLRRVIYELRNYANRHLRTAH